MRPEPAATISTPVKSYILPETVSCMEQLAAILTVDELGAWMISVIAPLRFVFKLESTQKEVPDIIFTYHPDQYSATGNITGINPVTDHTDQEYCFRVNDQVAGKLTIYSSAGESAIDQTSFAELMQSLHNSLSICLARIVRRQELIDRQQEEINQYRKHLEDEKLYLQGEVNSNVTYADIIGQSEEMKKIFHQLSQVAGTDSTVLILGETGTGKELVAKAIHNSSPRKNGLMVKVNCAAMPANLVESELFGHEKGSFTGAMERRIGKFELANNGTLFLDEIGELPLELQSKLLRVIQEKEIERIGGKSVIKVNVRLITATNRDLYHEVETGRFRLDLFYRLNVFPILLPPLRSRKQDIPLLALHFLHKYARNNGKDIRNISGKAIKQMMAYHWPGNVRELEHLLERTVLETPGRTVDSVHLPDSRKRNHPTEQQEDFLKSHEENERDHILKVLNHCNGKIFGPGGAAEILGLKPSTLNSKIRKLGIIKNRAYS